MVLAISIFVVRRAALKRPHNDALQGRTRSFERPAHLPFRHLAALAVSLTLRLHAELQAAAEPARSHAESELQPTSRSVPADLGSTLPPYIAFKWRLRTPQTPGRRAHCSSSGPALRRSSARSGRHREGVLLPYTGNPGDLNIKPDAVDPLEVHVLMQVSGRLHPKKRPTDSNGNVRVSTTKENISAGVEMPAPYLKGRRRRRHARRGPRTCSAAARTATTALWRVTRAPTRLLSGSGPVGGVRRTSADDGFAANAVGGSQRSNSR